jgi:acetyltransferase-like isoleucine patch superfamily enzyme
VVEILESSLKKTMIATRQFWQVFNSNNHQRIHRHLPKLLEMIEISNRAHVYPNVEFGDNVIVEQDCIIGIPVATAPEEKTVIGDHAIIRAGTYIYAGNQIGSNFQTGNKANIRELNVIGDNVSIGTMSVVEHHVIIHDNVRIHSQVFIPEYSLLEDGCWIGPNVVLTNARFPGHPDAKMELQGVHIHENVKIGANSTILPGVVIGANSLIGAGSVVVADIPENVIAAGNPSKKLRDVHY